MKVVFRQNFFPLDGLFEGQRFLRFGRAGLIWLCSCCGWRRGILVLFFLSSLRLWRLCRAEARTGQDEYRKKPCTEQVAIVPANDGIIIGWHRRWVNRKDRKPPDLPTRGAGEALRPKSGSSR